MDTHGIETSGRRILAVLIVPLVIAVAALSPARAAAAEAVTVVSSSHPDARLYRDIVTTPALARGVRVNVLVPDGYASTTTRYPVLYLFHGTSGGADDWLTSGDVRAATAGLPVIVVMPDGGYDSDGGSFFTNWVDQQTPLGTANWETFHVGQLVDWVDTNFRTRADRAHRAIAGLSQGGFGSFSYAARHPDTFVSAAAFSGAPDIARNPVAKVAGAAVVGAIATGLDGVEPDAMFGNPVLDDVNWQGHNPASLVTNLAPVDLELWTGNGLPGPLDGPTTVDPPANSIEAITHQSTLYFAQAADAAAVPYHLDDYGNGTHTWPYWSRDLTQYLPRLMATFGRPAPGVVSYTSIDRTWTQWGWSVVNHRIVAQQFTGLSGASTAGFTFTGAAATVTTPPVYVAGNRYQVRTGSMVRILTAGPDRRLVVDVSGSGPTSITRATA